MTDDVTVYSFQDPDTPILIPKNFTGKCSSVNKYHKLNRVGEGTYGIVYRARLNEKLVALKRIRLDTNSDGFPVSSLREISLLKSLKHPNIVQIDKVVVSNNLNNIFMVMEYCEQDLAYLIDNIICKTNPFNSSQIKCLMVQLLDGIEYLHERYIIHRDLKLSNLLLNSRGELKIADFGLARSLDSAGAMTPNVVTLWYRAPEILLGETKYTNSIDLWSAGCIFGEFIRSEALLPGSTDLEQIKLICRLLGSPNTSIWPEISMLPLYDSIRLPVYEFDSLSYYFKESSKATKDLLKRFLTYRPSHRINVKAALQHHYFQESPRGCLPAMMPTYPEIRNRKHDLVPTNNNNNNNNN